MNDIVVVHPQTSHKVTKANDLVSASYQLTLQEQRLLLITIGQIDSRKPIHKPITVRATDFAEVYNIPLKQAYEAMIDACNTLYDRDIKTKESKSKTVRFRWVDRVEYEKGEGCATLHFTVHVLPYLSMLNKHFTTYELRRVAHLNSIHSIRMFELFMQFRETGWYTIEVDAFREMLELGDSYARFNNLRQKVIDPSIKELKAKSNLDITYETHTEGRTVKRLTFRFKESDQMRLDLSEPLEPLEALAAVG